MKRVRTAVICSAHSFIEKFMIPERVQGTRDLKSEEYVCKTDITLGLICISYRGNVSCLVSPKKIN